VRGAGIACGPLNDFAAVVKDPQVIHRGMFREMPDPACGTLTFVANPIRLSEAPPDYVRAPPALGQHGAEVLQEWLGMDEAALATIKAEIGG